MKKQTVIPRKKRGPPATGKGEPIVVRMHSPALETLDAWIAAQMQPFPSRPEAIRRLVEIGIAVKQRPKRPSLAGAHRAKELASQAIDKLDDPAAHPDERAHRRHKLTKGPEEFREVRVDRAKVKGK